MSPIFGLFAVEALHYEVLELSSIVSHVLVSHQIVAPKDVHLSARPMLYSWVYRHR